MIPVGLAAMELQLQGMEEFGGLPGCPAKLAQYCQQMLLYQDAQLPRTMALRSVRLLELMCTVHKFSTLGKHYQSKPGFCIKFEDRMLSAFRRNA
jgi:hypothetical protein